MLTVIAACLFAITHMIRKLGQFAKPFSPTLHRICLNALADTHSETLRLRGVQAFKTLIGMSDRVDWLISELVTGTKSPNQGVVDSMLKVLYEVVSKAGGGMSEASRKAILALIDADEGEDGKHHNIIAGHAYDGRFNGNHPCSIAWNDDQSAARADCEWIDQVCASTHMSEKLI
jgi:hypothetical protein